MLSSLTSRYLQSGKTAAGSKRLIAAEARTSVMTTLSLLSCSAQQKKASLHLCTATKRQDTSNCNCLSAQYEPVARLRRGMHDCGTLLKDLHLVPHHFLTSECCHMFLLHSKQKTLIRSISIISYRFHSRLCSAYVGYAIGAPHEPNGSYDKPV